MLFSRRLVCSVIAGTMLAAPVGAQTDPAPDDTIVVNGKRVAEPKTVGDQARAITVRPADGGPLARQYQALCVNVFGVRKTVAEAIAQRIADNARAFNVPVAGSPCTANAWVGTFRGGRGAAERLRRDQPWLFEGLTDFQVKSIFQQSEAAFAWHRTERRNADGSVIPLSQGIGGMPGEYSVNKLYSVGRLISPARIDLSTSIVLIDAASATGKSVGQIADYATMRLLASVTDTPRSADAPLDTILSLFSGPNPPRALTPFDQAYLSGIYRLNTGAGAAAVADATAASYRQQKGRGADNRPAPN